MLKSVNKRYLTFGIIILLAFLPLLAEYSAIYIWNIITLVAYYKVIAHSFNQSNTYFTRKRLGLTVFFYSLFFVIVNKLISFYYTDNFFVFSEADAITYHQESIEMASKSFSEGINLISERYEFEDLGAFIVISSFYRIIESNLIINVFYIITGVITSLSIFRICKNFISIKYSFLCSLTYCTSSFVIWFHSSGLKESVFVMIIILFYDHYYIFVRTRKLKYLLFSICFLLSILLFRPAILFFCVFSIVMATLLTLKGKVYSFLLLIAGITLVFFLYSYISLVSERYLLGGTEEMLAIKEASGMVKQGSVQFTYMVNILASALGPLPTVLTAKPVLSFFSIGLIYRVFLSTAFWLGVFYAVKNKAVLMYPLLLFIFMEMITLTFILEGLELRKSLPHISFVFVLAFWFLDNYDKQNIGSKSVRRTLKYAWNISSVLFLIIIVYWNYRL